MNSYCKYVTATAFNLGIRDLHAPVLALVSVVLHRAKAYRRNKAHHTHHRAVHALAALYNSVTTRQSSARCETALA